MADACGALIVRSPYKSSLMHYHVHLLHIISLRNAKRNKWFTAQLGTISVVIRYQLIFLAKTLIMSEFQFYILQSALYKAI